jgi:hypothetical protein
MKKLMTLVCAAVVALTLSMPAWSQSTTGAKKQAAPTAQKESKADKKEAAKKKKDADKKTKEDKKEAKASKKKK